MALMIVHHAEGILLEAQGRAASLYGALETRYLVNGSTSGILAAVSAGTSRGGEILMARNCHKAAYHAAYLRGLKTHYVFPKTDRVMGLNGGISPADVRKMLENYPGIQCVAQASNGKAALEQIEEKDPDFVITDMKMPIMDGTQLLPVLSTQYPEKYIIVISGYKDFDYAKEALRAKTLDYIVKPFSREALCSAVDKAVELLQSRETLQEKSNFG